MKNLIVVMLFSTFVFAFKVGDTLDEQTKNQLGIIDLDKIYVVDFFASWCKSCKIELPLISELSTKNDKSSFEIIGVDMDESLEDGKNFVQSLDLKMKVVYDDSNEIVGRFNPVGVPALYYIKNGKVVKTLFGAVPHIDKIILEDVKGL
jgi:thiol-disulfide isomerase/thioredoxin